MWPATWLDKCCNDVNWKLQVYLERGRQAKERYKIEVALYEEKAAKDSSNSTEGGGKTSEGGKLIYR